MGRLDALCPYPTPKIARIKDSKLGLLRYALMTIIVVYVIGLQIMWRGNHLETQEVAGVYQLQLDHPTRRNCNPMNVKCMPNFTSQSQLPYCAQSPDASSIKLPCQYWDAQQLTQLTDQGLMVPTHISKYYQTKGCKPDASNNWSCEGWLYDFLDKKGNVQKKRGQASPISDIFVADVERYTIMIDHSVRSTMGARSYASEMVGYWLDCNGTDQSDSGCTPRPISCGHDGCLQKPYATPTAPSPSTESRPKFRGDRRSLSLAGRGSGVHNQSQTISADPKKTRDKAAPPDAPKKTTMEGDDTVAGRVDHLESLGAVSLLEGDMFTIGMLLKAANVSLDKRRHHVPSWVGGSYRSSGFVLVIRIHYSNVEPWLGMKVLPWNMLGPPMHYTYRITKHASHDDFMLRQVRHGGINEPNNSLVVKEFHGIRVLVEQSGTIAIWNNIQLLLILTTTLALMALSNCITDTVALYCMPESDEYWAIKYERPRTRKGLGRTGSRLILEETDEQDADDSVVHYSSMTM